MKKIVFLMMVSGLLFIYNNKSSAQKDQKSFTGTITYSLTYEGAVDPATLAQMPKEKVIKVYGNKSKTEIDQGPVHAITINDGDKKEVITLMDISIIGKKIMMKKTAEDIQKDLAKQAAPTIKLLDETKEIAGYKCKKGEIITKDEDGKENTASFYYTDELGTGDKNFDNYFKDIKGTLMEYTQNAGNMSIKMTVTKVKKQKLSENDFLVPSGYEEMTMEQFQEMLQGGGGNR